MTSYLKTLRQGQHLSQEEVQQFLNDAIDGKISEEEKLDFLQLQNEKGVTAEELAFAAEHLQRDIPVHEAMDVCGTGGSGIDRINASTLAAFVLAALGVPVAKHGNKAASGRFGSFDLLEALGINILLTPEQSEAIFNELGLAFFFAPQCFPEMGAFMQARKTLGQPTMFNLLGPLLSPLRPRKQLIGTATPENAQLLLEAAMSMHKEVVVVVGDRGLDEVTPSGKSTFFTPMGEQEVSVADFGLEAVDFPKLIAESREEKIQFAKGFLAGKELDSPKALLVLMNVALALKVFGAEEELSRGVGISREMLKNGKVQEMFEKMLEATNTSL